MNPPYMLTDRGGQIQYTYVVIRTGKNGEFGGIRAKLEAGLAPFTEALVIIAQVNEEEILTLAEEHFNASARSDLAFFSVLPWNRAEKSIRSASMWFAMRAL